MAIALVYIGQNRFFSTAQKNHQELINKLKSKHELNVYNFIKSQDDATCPFNSSGGIQVWDFLNAIDLTSEEILIKFRTDLWFTQTSMLILQKELDKVLRGELDTVFLGLDFLNGYNKIKMYTDFKETKKVTDFVIITKRNVLRNREDIVRDLTGVKKKSGNQMFKSIIDENAMALSVSCQIYLLRKDYTDPENYIIYKDWTSEYHKSQESQLWVSENPRVIRKEF
ncbi:hypothetical protein EB118_00245 [bacterium]|nr:hypothetical protein [bacterium]